MKAAVLSIGTELLFGSIVNTNTVYISKELQALGIDVMYHMTVGDNPGRLKNMLGIIYQDCDLVICSGGLGPTQDDLTKETIADYFGVQNIEDKDQVAILENRFKKFGRVLTENNYKQACLPEGSLVLANSCGTAPGFILEKNGKIISAMPGPPREMTEMFQSGVKPYLEKLQGSYLFYRTLRTINIGESMLETKLLPLIDGQSDPTLATYAKDYETTLRVASKRSSLEEATAAVNEMCEKVRSIAGEYIYSYDDEDLGECVVKELIRKGLSISAAESMTGGQFAKSVTDVSGASAILKSSYITYSDEEKNRILGVDLGCIKNHGVVSKEVAIQMAEGLHKVTGSDICVSVTGYAGPDGDDVGLYYIGLYYKDQTIGIEKRAFKYSRAFIRGHAVHEMFAAIYGNCIKQ